MDAANPLVFKRDWLAATLHKKPHDQSARIRPARDKSRRTRTLSVRLTSGEYAKLERLAAGQTVGSYVRSCLFEKPSDGNRTQSNGDELGRLERKLTKVMRTLEALVECMEVAG